MGWVWIALLACAVGVLVAAEWPRLGGSLNWEGPRARSRKRRKAQFRVVRTDEDDFAASVKRDLEKLPTTKDRDRS